jgi:hypothetical protein
MVPVEGKITKNARSLYFTLMWLAQKQSWRDGQEKFTAPLADVLKTMRYESRNMAEIRDALTAMVTTAIVWQSPSGHEISSWGVSGMISHAEIVKTSAGSILEWSYSPKIRPSLLDPDLYARGLEAIELGTNASMALYDICKRYQRSATYKNGLTPRHPWRWWHPVLTGVPDGVDDESEWKIFHRDVIKPAVGRINSRMPLEVRPIVHKVGNRVVDLQFQVIKKVNFRSPDSKPTTASGLKEVGRLIAAGISQRQAELLFEEHGEEEIARGADILETRQANQSLPVVQSPARYIVEVLKNNVTTDSSSVLVTVKKQDAREKQRMLQLLDDYRKLKMDQAWALYRESTDADKAQLLDEFRLQSLVKAPASTQRLFEQKGLAAVVIQSLMRNFLAVHFFGELWNKPSNDDLLRFAVAR